MADESEPPKDDPVPDKPPAPRAAPVIQAAVATTVTHGTLIMGTYEIESLINSGGMGEVYRGRNIHNDEPVAIKIVLPSLAHDQKIVALFQKESTVLSRLSHEAIVRYHVFTNDPTIGRPCMVMEFVSGQALSDRIEQGPMPVEEVKTMLRRVASGLDKAHRAGVVHRDLSPDNVILEDGSVEHAKLIDFGIAKSSSFGSGTLLQGQFAGKFNWVAPEQLGAFGGAVDGRSDVYSLALVTAAASRGEALQMGASIVDAVSKRSSVPDLTGVDPTLVPLLSWMLQPDPGQRCDSMNRVIRALDDASQIPGPPAPAAPDTNKTVIGGALPVINLPPIPAAPAPAPVSAAPVSAPPVSTPPVSAPLVSAPPVSAPAVSVLPVSPPPARTVIADATIPPAPAPITRPPAPEVPDDSSPFGAPAVAQVLASPAPRPLAEPTPNSTGKGGIIAVALVALAGAGGGAAWLSGAFSSGNEPVTVASVPADAPAAPDDGAAKEAEAKAAAEAEASAKAANDKAAADKLAADKAAADKAAADQAALDKAAADKAAEEKAAAGKAAEEQTAAEKAAADKAAADQAAADQAAADQAAADKAAADKAAADQAAAEKAAADQAAKDKVAADQAAADAAAAAIAADPMVRQTKHLASLDLPACTYLDLKDPQPKGFVLNGFAFDAPALEGIAADWQTATGASAALTQNLIDQTQCPALEFAANLPRGELAALGLTLDQGAASKSGAAISGKITGAGGRPLTLFLVNEAGGVTEMSPHVTTGADGGQFSFMLTLPKGAAPTKQLLLALASDEALATALRELPAGSDAEGVFAFLTKNTADLAGGALAGLSVFTLEE